MVKREFKVKGKEKKFGVHFLKKQKEDKSCKFATSSERNFNDFRKPRTRVTASEMCASFSFFSSRQTNDNN